MQGLLHEAGVQPGAWSTQPQAFRPHGLGHGPVRRMAGREAQVRAGGRGMGRGVGKGKGGGGGGRGGGGGGKGSGGGRGKGRR